MDFQWNVIIKNISGSEQIVDDLGLVLVDSTSGIDLSEMFTYDEITGSDSLRSLVSSDYVVVNDGVNDLSVADGVKYLTLGNIKDLEENYYSKSQLETTGQASIHYENLTNVPTLGTPNWKAPVLARILKFAEIGPGGAAEGEFFIDTDDNHLYKYVSSSWTDQGVPINGDRIINLDVTDGTSQNIYEWLESTWTDIGESADNDTILVNDDGDSDPAQYVYDNDEKTWLKIGDYDFTTHLNGGANKHDASEVDIENSYSNFDGEQDLESTLDSIDTELTSINSNVSSNDTDIANNADAIASNDTDIANNATDISNNADAIAAHENGGANKHDASEVDVESDYTNFTGEQDLESVLNSIDNKLDEIEVDLTSANAVSLDEAYDNEGSGLGRNINADSGAVKIDTGEATNAPLELAPKSFLPTTNLSDGQVAVKDGIMFIYDETRTKWISVTRMFVSFGRKGKTKDMFLSFFGGTLASNNSGLRMARDAVIVSIAGQFDESGTGSFNIRKNDEVNNIASLPVTDSSGAQSNTINIDIDAGDFLQCCMLNNVKVEDPVVMIEIAWRA